jgi:hypothetical protein
MLVIGDMVAAAMLSRLVFMELRQLREGVTLKSTALTSNHTSVYGLACTGFVFLPFPSICLNFARWI